MYIPKIANIKPDKTMSMLSTRKLSFSYPTGRSFAFSDFSCAKGENTLIHGVSGSGKTTLLHLLAGILTPSSGKIFMDGKDISGFTPKDKDRFRGRNLGMIFQKHFFIQGLTVYENLIAAQKLSGQIPDKKYLDNLLDLLGISGLKSNKADALSQGEQQRFSIARAMANKPLWILADEPTSSLDDENCLRFVELMHISTGIESPGWIIASHDNRLREHFKNVYQI
jgi:ABC-type lipoprotein export system ATPase subunit